EYLVARRIHLGPLLARHDPAGYAAFAAAAAEIGYGPVETQRQWAALALVCAFRGVAPVALDQAGLDRAREALIGASLRIGRGAQKNLRGKLYGLEATLFHAGITEELPRRRSPTKADQRAAAWAALAAGAPTLVATAQRYLAQLALSLRPGTVRNS